MQLLEKENARRFQRTKLKLLCKQKIRLQKGKRIVCILNTSFLIFFNYPGQFLR